jgi:hypothetical protein
VTGFEANVEDLAGHAAHLDALAEEAAAAVDAVNTAVVGADAYGKLGAPLAARLNALQDAGRRSITNAAEGIAVAAADIRDAAAEYADTEQDNVQRITDSGEEVGD